MDLSNDLISKFVKITHDSSNKKSSESTVYGTTVEYNDRMYVRIDGSDLLTPVETTADMQAGERVTIMIKNHSATVTGNITSPSASSTVVTELGTDVSEIGNQITEFEIVIADKVDTKQLVAERAQIEELIAGKASIEELEAVDAKIENLEVGNLDAVNAEIENLKANKADITDLNAANAEIENLQADKADITLLNSKYANIETLIATKADITDLDAIEADIVDLKATKADITDLNATNANIDILDAEVADIQTLVNGNLTSDNILSFNITADKVTVDDAFIQDAHIQNVSASKINTGTLNTNNVNIQSDDGSMLIQGNLQQFKDANDVVRIQIGKDATGDFTFALYDATGEGQLINADGIQSSNAIADGIIVDANVSEGANISGGKLDISSVITEINNDNSTTIKSTKIYLNDQEQTLEVAFNSLKTQVDTIQDVTIDGDLSSVIDQVQSNTTQIEVNKGNINTLISENTIRKEEITNLSGDVIEVNDTLSAKYTSLEQDLEGFKTTVNDTYAEKSTVTDLETNLETNYSTTSAVNSAIDQKANEITSTVSDTYATKTSVTDLSNNLTNNYSTTTSMNSAIDQKADGILNTVSSTYAEKSTVTNLETNLETNYSTTTAMNSAIDQKADSILNTVSSTYVTQETVNDLEENLETNYLTTTEMNSAIDQKADSILNTVSSTYAEKSTVTDLETNLETNYSTTSAMNSAIDQKAYGILNTVSSTYAEKSTVTNLETNLETNYSTTSAMNSAINQKANEITSTVSETYTTKVEYDSLSIGGRNYIKGGKGDNKTGFFANFNKVENGYGEHTLTSQNTYYSVDISSGFVLGCRDYEVGKEVTFSYEIMYTDWNFPDGTNRNELWMGQRYTSSSTSTDGAWRGVTQHELPVVGQNGCELNKWFKVEKTMTIPEQAESSIGTADVIQLYNSNADVSASVTFRLRNVKLEYGNKATDWTPAPEDVEDSINNVEEHTSTVEQIAKKIEWIVTSDSTSSSVKLTDAAYEVIADNVIITADHINLNGYVSQDDSNWSIDTQGNMEAKNLTVDDELSTEVLNVNKINNPEYPSTLSGDINLYVSNLTGSDDYTLDDILQSYDESEVQGSADLIKKFYSLRGVESALPRNLNGKTVRIYLETDDNGQILFRNFASGRILIFLCSHEVKGYIGDYNCYADFKIYGGSNQNEPTTYGVIRPSTNTVYSSDNSSVFIQKSPASGIYHCNIYGGSSASGYSAVKVTEDCMCRIELCNFYSAYTFVNISSLAQVYCNKTTGKATDYAFKSYTGSMLHLANTTQASGTKGNVYCNNGSVIYGTLAQTISGTNGITWDGSKAVENTTTTPKTTTETVTYKSNYGDTYRSTVYNNWKKDGTCRQGDYGYGDCTGLWFFGTAFAEVKGNTINKVTITIKRQTGGTSASVEHKLWMHNYSTRPSGAPTLTSGWSKTFNLAVGNSTTITITDSTVLNAIKNGTCKGFAIRHTYNSSHYSVCSGSATVKITYTE